MTTATLETFAKKYDRKFILLLEDWGRWERTAAKVQGWGKGRSDPPHFIDDLTALQINKSFGVFKAKAPTLAALLTLRYIRNLDALDIKHQLRFELKNKANYVTASFLDELIELATFRFFEELQHA